MNATNANVTTSYSGNTVNQKGLTISGISILNKIYDGNNLAIISGIPTYLGLTNGDTFSVTGIPSASFNNKNVGLAKPISVSGYSAPSENYFLLQPTGLTADITSKELTVSSPAVISKTYDGNTTAALTGTLIGIIPGDESNVTLIGLGTFATFNVGTNIEVTSISTLNGSESGNYALIQPTNLIGNITTKTLTLTAHNVTKELGQVLIGGSGSTSFSCVGLVGSETVGTVTINYGAAGGPSGEGATIGTYVNQVIPSLATGGTFNPLNYTIIYLSGSITVSGFYPGNILVERLGNGSSALSGAASNLNVLELNSEGTLIQTVSTQFLNTNLLTESGTATSNGYFNSFDLRVGFVGYNSPLGTLSVSSQNSKAVNILNSGAFVVKRSIFPTGGPSAIPPSPFSGSNVRSIIPITDSTYYVSGTSSQTLGQPITGGLWYFNGNSFSQINSSAAGFPTNYRNIEIFNNQLYFSSTTGNFIGISKIGNGLSTSSNEIPESVIFMGSGASPYGFSFSPDNNTCYISDDRASVLGGIQKWVKIDGFGVFLMF